MDGVEVLIPIVGTITLFGMICFVVWVSARNHQRVTQMRTEFHQKMLEKFGSATEFIEFAKTPEGRRFLEGAAVGATPDPAKLLASVRRGILMTLLGIGFFSMIGLFDADVEPAGFFGVILVALGLGYLISAFVSRRLLHSWKNELSGTVRDPRAVTE